jgi:hypothetical protein
MRVLQQQDHVSIGQLAETAGITQPAATQTVALMKADSLDAELPHPLSQCLTEAIAALEARPFGTRIREARAAPSKTRGRKP